MRGVKSDVQLREATVTASAAWALQLKAVALADASRLIRMLSGSIRGNGGWVLSRGTTDAGLVNLLFEFERHACVEIYAALIGAGLELSQHGHQRFTELCQCTRNQKADCGSEIVSVDLEIQTFSIEEPQHEHWPVP